MPGLRQSVSRVLSRAVSPPTHEQSFIYARRYRRAPAAYPDAKEAGNPTTHPYMALLPTGFTWPTRLPEPPVRSYRTLSPSPTHIAARHTSATDTFDRAQDARHDNRHASAVYFLWHFPSIYTDRELPGAVPYGARTFLSSPQ